MLAATSIFWPACRGTAFFTHSQKVPLSCLQPVPLVLLKSTPPCPPFTGRSSSESVCNHKSLCWPPPCSSTNKRTPDYSFHCLEKKNKINAQDPCKLMHSFFFPHNLIFPLPLEGSGPCRNTLTCISLLVFTSTCSFIFFEVLMQVLLYILQAIPEMHCTIRMWTQSAC